jgi:hypothetical protein
MEMAAQPAASYPPLLEQAGNAIKAAAKFVANGGKKVSDEEQARRLAICHACEFYDAKQVRCMKCACFVNLKSLLASEHCPINKW